MYCDYFNWCVSCTVVVLICFVICGVRMCGFCNVWMSVRMGFIMCGICNECFNIVSFMYIYSFYAFVLFCKLCIFIVMFMYSYCYVFSILYILFSSRQLAFFGYPD